MFGYRESPYKVEKKAALPKAWGVQHLEVRQPSQSPGRTGLVDYIALEGNNAKGKLVQDLLFRYDSRDKLDRDWTLLTSGADVKRADLDYIEMIREHHVGYTKSGGVTMY